MAPLKAPSSDNFHAVFFQNQRDTLGRDIFRWVQGIFAGNIIEPNLNNTLLVILSKINNPESFTQFCPINLYSVLYKLVMKVIPNRF